MSVISGLTLKWRLLAGFLLCAMLTVLSGGAGILSLRQIQDNMKDSTREIEVTIDHQNEQIRQFMPLRSLVESIIASKNEKELEDADKKLKDIRGADTIQSSKKDTTIFETVSRLIVHKRNQLSALRDLTALRNSTIAVLDEVTKLSMSTVDNVEFDSTIKIDDAMEEIKVNFANMSGTTGTAMSSIKAAMSVRSYCGELNVLVKDALLATDAASIDYAKTEITTLIGNAKNELALVPSDETTAKIDTSLDSLSGLVEKMFNKKKQMLTDNKGTDKISAGNLSTLSQKSNAALDEVTQLAMSTVDNVEFDSAIKIDDTVDGIKVNFTNMSSTTGTAISSIKAAMSVRSYCSEINALVKDALLAADAASVEYAKTESITLVGNAKKELASVPSDETTAKVGKALDSLSGLVEKMFNKKKQMLLSEKDLGSTSAEILQQMRKLDNKMLLNSENMKSNAKKTLETSAGMVSKWRNFIVCLCLCAFVLAVIIGLSVSRSISRPVIKTVGLAEKMSEGDFTQTLDIDRKDEIGSLVGALNNMGSSLKGMFKGIATGIKTLSVSSGNLSGISQQMSKGADETSGKSNTVTIAAEEMSSNMNSVAAAVEEASTNIGMVAAATEEMKATINEIAQNSEKARSITDEAVSNASSASEKVDELGKAAKEISTVTETIANISKQTNLLALNATIEAARAGESGKGFSVVANEIKELARQTAEATQEIKTKIEGIQTSTAGTVTEIEQISKVINEVNEIVSIIATAVEEQSVTTKEIADNVSQASQGIAEVTENVAQSSTVAGEIARDIADVNQASNEMSTSSSQVNISAEELAGLADQLKEMVERFKV